MSAEEKRTRMLQLFYEKKDFFQLKELEKIAPKEKGIITQSVKDVVQSLVDDGMVDTDKIGTSVYFWAFPSKAQVSRKRKVQELMERMEIVGEKLKKSKEDLDALKTSDNDTEEKSKILTELAELKTKKEDLMAEVQKLKDNDPEVLQSMKKSTQVCFVICFSHYYH